MTLLTFGTATLLTTGEWRLDGALPPDFATDEAGTLVGQGPVAENRLRVALDLKDGPWELKTEWDLFSGQFAGDTWDLPVDIDARHREDLGIVDAGSFLPRQAWVQTYAAPIQVQLGLTTSHWGLGMVANDGAHTPLFGRADFGDRVLRLRVATRPNGPETALTLLGAADRVVSDDSASMAEGQSAWQAVFAALAVEGENQGGVYVVYRDQTEEDGVRRTRAGVLDLYGSVVAPMDGMDLVARAEAAGITGNTSRSRTYQHDSLQILSGGALAAVGLRDPRWGVDLWGGWASGDGNPDDGAIHDFSFDRDANVGMVLFDEIGGATEAQTYTHLIDPEHTGAPPDGADATVTEGSFRRATFVQPVLTLAPAEWLGVKLGYVAAWSTAPIANPYTSFRNGGTPTNALGAETTGPFIGTEIDASLRIGAPKAWALRPEVEVQGAWYTASADWGGMEGTYLRGMVRAAW